MDEIAGHGGERESLGVTGDGVSSLFSGNGFNTGFDCFRTVRLRRLDGCS
jgi:hypothetical protein